MHNIFSSKNIFANEIIKKETINLDYNNYNFTFTRTEDCTKCSKISKIKSFFTKEVKTQTELVGNATWTLLHAMANNYPTKPDAKQLSSIEMFINLLAKNFPCYKCKYEFVDYVQKNKPKFNNKRCFVEWVCNFHNRINQKLGKNKYDCTKLY